MQFSFQLWIRMLGNVKARWGKNSQSKGPMLGHVVVVDLNRHYRNGMNE